jgi:hypothetical protein
MKSKGRIGDAQVFSAADLESGLSTYHILYANILYAYLSMMHIFDSMKKSFSA